MNKKSEASPFERVNTLVTKHHYAFQSWNDRYSKGVWASLAPCDDLLDEVRESTSDGDLDMIPSTEYFSNTKWLPIVLGYNFVDALVNLEARLSKIPNEMFCRNSMWESAIIESLKHLRAIRNAGDDYGKIDGKFLKLPKTFDEMVKLKSDNESLFIQQENKQ